MANTIMTTVYNHYMTTYSPKRSDARLDSHKKSELKNIYSNIIKLNKESPLYLFDRSERTTNIALSLKENTRQLQHTILDTAGTAKEDLFKNKVAYSSNTKVADVKFIGDSQELTESPASYELEVQKLATGQINSGWLLDKDAKSLTPGNYSFDINMNNMAYEFQFSVSQDDTNYDIQTKLARLFNHANIGLNASIMEGPDNTFALKIASSQTGENSTPDKPLFTIQNTSANGTDVVDYLGIDYIASEASNAYFTINGVENSTTSNHFTIDKTYEITLNGVTAENGETTTIGVKTNIDSLKDNIYNLISGYNSFLKAADELKRSTSSGKLTYEVTGVAKLYRNELDAVGINITENGSLSIDDNLLTQTANSEEAYDLLSPLKDFSSSLFQKGEEISRHPLEYANKKIVAYKNPGKNFTSPYAMSNYSGLLFNSYC